MTDAGGRSKIQHVGRYRIIEKLDTSQFDPVAQLKFVRRPRPQLLPIYEQTVAAAQVFDRVAASRADDSGVLARNSVRLSIFIGQINIGRNAEVRVETAQYQFLVGWQRDMSPADSQREPAWRCAVGGN
jgi:hypothetical protein